MLETVMQDLIAALNANTAALKGGAATTAAAPAAPKTAKPAAPAGNGSLSYDDIKVPFLALCRSHGAEAGRELCKKFGHENLKTVKPEQFADVLKAIKEAAAAPAA